MPFKLIIANKAYSSWSFRSWILLAHFKIPFEEVVIPLDLPTTRKAILKYSPSGKVPALFDGALEIWDSLAIAEYAAERYPTKAIWPKTRAARAHARAVSAEMHSSFQNLRGECPMSFVRTPKAVALSEGARENVARIEQIWAHARKTYGKGGPFLFGKFSAADAMYAPVVNRFHAYDIKVSKATRAYMAAMMALPAWQAWEKDAQAESWRVAKYDAL